MAENQVTAAQHELSQKFSSFIEQATADDFSRRMTVSNITVPDWSGIVASDYLNSRHDRLTFQRTENPEQGNIRNSMALGFAATHLMIYDTMLPFDSQLHRVRLLFGARDDQPLTRSLQLQPSRSTDFDSPPGFHHPVSQRMGRAAIRFARSPLVTPISRGTVLSLTQKQSADFADLLLAQRERWNQQADLENDPEFRRLHMRPSRGSNRGSRRIGGG